MNMRSLIPSIWSHEDDKNDGFRQLQRQIDRVFDDFSRGFGMPSLFKEDGAWTPRCDISEDDKSLNLTVELPGVEEKDVEVTVLDNVLTVKGEKKSERKDEKKDYHLVERSYGMFSRSIPLAFKVDPAKVDATFKKGVLSVTLPKPPEQQARSRKVAIKAG